MSTSIRAIIVAGLLVWSFTDTSRIKPVVPVPSYTGPLVALHSTSRDMSEVSRDSLSDTLDSAAAMIASDKASAIKTTDQLQAAVKATIAFGHTAFVDKRYATVASSLQTELERSVGPVSAKLTPELRAKVASSLRECARAVR